MGCSNDTNAPRIVVQTEYVTPTIPDSNLVCPPLPIPPSGDTATQKDVAIYIVDLIGVAEHCKQDLATVKRIITEAIALLEEPPR